MLLYTISQFLKHHWNAAGINFPMMYHTVLYTLYSACTRQFNNIYTHFGNYGNTYLPTKMVSMATKIV